MRSNNIKSWHYTNQLEGLLYFASLIDEITFNYSIDAHKAPALNVISLLQDVYVTINNVDKGIIKEASLPSLLDELSSAINEDKLFKDILTKRNLLYFSTIVQTPRNLKELKLLIEMMVSGGIGEEYYQSIKDYLIHNISTAKEKNNIGYYTRILVTHLKYCGYSSEYIYFTNRDYFFGKREIEDISEIKGFLDIFNEKENEYVVLFKGNQIFNLLETTFRKLGDAVMHKYELDYKIAEVEKFTQNLSLNNPLVVINVAAKDPYAAREYAISKIRTVSNLFCCYQHKQRTIIKPKCLIINKETSIAQTINKPLSAILRCRDLRPHKSLSFFNHISNNLSLSEESFKCIMKSLKMHESAVEADSLENQFINLFTALEIIIPKDVKSGKSRIDQIYDTLVPFLCLDYCRKHIRCFISDLLRLYFPETKSMLSQIHEGNRLEDKICALLTLQKYDSLRQQLKEVFSNHNEILLRNRLYRLEELMKKPDKLLMRIKKHKERLKQQIDRIYRTRNLIVHAGDTPFYIDTLIENLHFYYDTLVKQLLYDNTINHFSKLDQIYISFYIKELNFENKLQEISNNVEKKGMFDESNYSMIINTIN